MKILEVLHGLHAYYHMDMFRNLLIPREKELLNEINGRVLTFWLLAKKCADKTIKDGKTPYDVTISIYCLQELLWECESIEALMGDVCQIVCYLCGENGKIKQEFFPSWHYEVDKNTKEQNAVRVTIGEPFKTAFEWLKPWGKLGERQ